MTPMTVRGPACSAADDREGRRLPTRIHCGRTSQRRCHGQVIVRNRCVEVVGVKETKEIKAAPLLTDRISEPTKGTDPTEGTIVMGYESVDAQHSSANPTIGANSSMMTMCRVSTLRNVRATRLRDEIPAAWRTRGLHEGVSSEGLLSRLDSEGGGAAWLAAAWPSPRCRCPFDRPVGRRASWG
jgi:hypothetical protein